MAKNTFTLLFRGEHVQTFTSVHDVQAVRLGYRRYPTKAQNYLDSIVSPNGTIASKPEVLRQMKTVAALKRDGVPSRFDTYVGQHFIVVVHPGVTEITDLDPV